MPAAANGGGCQEAQRDCHGDGPGVRHDPVRGVHGDVVHGDGVRVTSAVAIDVLRHATGAW